MSNVTRRNNKKDLYALLVVINGNLFGFQLWRHFLGVVMGKPAGHQALVVDKSIPLKARLENEFVLVTAMP